METRELRALLERVAKGEASIDEAECALRTAPFTDLGYAKADHHRGMRQGVSEVVYGEGKTAGQIAGICRALACAGQKRVLVTRLDAKKAAEVERLLFDGDDAVPLSFEYRDLPRIGILGELPEPDGEGSVVVAAAGTSDLPVAEEAAVTAEVLGNEVVRLYDVGVAGIHRLLAHMDEIAAARAVVAVAGMEGALASVVGGLASCPVIAVPTSVGYGASFGGVAALLAMLNSCASGVSVVNIDNGFGAGYQAHLVNHARASLSCGKGSEANPTLRWNLEENATRRHLLHETLLHLPKARRAQVLSDAKGAGVPDSHHHDLREVLATIDGLSASGRVKDDMRAVYRILAEAEASAHGCSVDETHFHEVGNGEALENVLAICLAVEALGPVEVVATRVQVGSGTVVCAHGELPIPAPATAAIIARGISVCERRLPGERCTPTSAAVILHFVDRFED
ncbi:nickel pincer cofactor biosynthesis protein LarB [Gordonibacter sp. An230]|uniref:nickel pincer cofactor biosynthesis protein LarB n=1 Tax=Gordonibacter sp. An230 TaxID=1965592 RepID=UPI001EF57537|nr:nickel pincer cofactor biosynthesis protein LarB [Gordonibacter sp. An230]